MPRTPNLTQPSPERQQLNRSNDPAETARLDAEAPARAMTSPRQRLTGSAHGVGSVGFDDPGAFDVGSGTPASEGRVFGPSEIADSHGPDTDVETSRLRAGGVGPGSDTAGPDPREQRLQDDSGFDRENRDPDQDRPLSGSQ